MRSVQILIKSGFPFEAEELFFKIHSVALDNLRSSQLDEAKEGEEFISNEGKVIQIFESLLQYIADIAESLRSTFIFKTNERTNTGIYSNWLIHQVTITLHETFAQLSDELLTNMRKLTALYRRLTVAFGNYDVKGICCSFVLDKTFSE